MSSQFSDGFDSFEFDLAKEAGAVLEAIQQARK